MPAKKSKTKRSSAKSGPQAKAVGVARSQASAGQQISLDSLQDEVQLLLDRGKAKEAFKRVKIAQRKVTSGTQATLNGLLRTCYLHRAIDLTQDGLIDEARDQFRSMLALDIPHDRSEAQSFVRLCCQLQLLPETLGQLEGNSDQILWIRAQLRIHWIDRLVLAEQIAEHEPAELREPAERVRRAISEVESGQRPDWSDISRRSPLADWGLFLRGLIDYHDSADATQGGEFVEIWSRLDPERMARKLADRLIHLDRFRGIHDTVLSPEARRAVDEQLFGFPLTQELLTFSEWVEQHAWLPILDWLRENQDRLAKIDKEIPELFTLLLYDPLIDIHTDQVPAEGFNPETYLEDLFQAAQPLKFDPSWNRWRALEEETRRCPNSITIEQFWRLYLKDLQNSQRIRESEWNLCRSLVLKRVAMGHFSLIQQYQFHTPQQIQGLPESEQARFHHHRGEYFRLMKEVVSSSPHMAEYHEMALNCAVNWRDMERVQDLAKTWLEHHPNQFKPLLSLARASLTLGDLDATESYASQAQKLRPSDPEISSLLWFFWIVRLRVMIKARKKEQAQQHLDTWLQSRRPYLESYHAQLYQNLIDLIDREPFGSLADMATTLGEDQEDPLYWIELWIEARLADYPAKLLDQLFGQLKVTVKDCSYPELTRWAKLSFRNLQIQTPIESISEQYSLFAGRLSHVVKITDPIGLELPSNDLIQICKLAELLKLPIEVRFSLYCLGQRLNAYHPFFLLRLGELGVSRVNESMVSYEDGSKALIEAMFSGRRETQDPECIRYAQQAEQILGQMPGGDLFPDSLKMGHLHASVSDMTEFLKDTDLRNDPLLGEFDPDEAPPSPDAPHASRTKARSKSRLKGRTSSKSSQKAKSRKAKRTR